MGVGPRLHQRIENRRGQITIASEDDVANPSELWQSIRTDLAISARIGPVWGRIKG